MKAKRITIMILCLALLVVMGGEAILSAFSFRTMAEEATVEYTNAYNDLLHNVAFNPEDYPALPKTDPKYYSIELITIAPGENGELFVYVYQPSGSAGNIQAASINISTNDRGDKNFKNYKLELLNSYDVFYKYKVNGFNLELLPVRYLEISNILRPWSEKYGDQAPGGNNTVSEVGFPVGKLFTVTYTNGQASISVQDVEYIQITEKYVGYIRYEQDSIYPNYIDKSSTDAHFVAFSTDKPIDKLLEADVYYETQTYHAYKSGLSFSTDPWGEVTKNYKYLDYTQKAECELSDGNVFTSSPYIWDRIQKTTDFVSQGTPLYIFPGFSVDQNIPFTDEAKAELAKTKWVLSFTETNYNWWVHTDPINGSNGDYSHSFTRVGNVSVLRLKFQTNGIIYDLGVVDNKQTGSKDPAAVVEEQDWWQKIMLFLMLILLVLILTFVQGPLGIIGRILWSGIKFLFKLLIFLFLLPFRLLRWLFSKTYRKKTFSQFKVFAKDKANSLKNFDYSRIKVKRNSKNESEEE